MGNIASEHHVKPKLCGTRLQRIFQFSIPNKLQCDPKPHTGFHKAEKIFLLTEPADLRHHRMAFAYGQRRRVVFAGNIIGNDRNARFGNRILRGQAGFHGRCGHNGRTTARKNTPFNLLHAGQFG